MQSRKTTTRTYRLDVELIDGLKKAARREGVSENHLVQSTLSQRTEADPLVHAFPYIVLSRQTLVPILGATNPHGLEIAAFDLGRKNFGLARELYESRGRELSFLHFVMNILDKQARWFEVEGAEDRPERLTLHHECGTKWSLFLRAYLTGTFDVVSHEKIKMTLNESYVSLELPTSQHR